MLATKIAFQFGLEIIGKVPSWVMMRLLDVATRGCPCATRMHAMLEASLARLGRAACSPCPGLSNKDVASCPLTR